MYTGYSGDSVLECELTSLLRSVYQETALLGRDS